MATTEQQRQEAAATDGQEVGSDQLKRLLTVSDPLSRIAEAVADITDEEAAELLSALGTQRGRQRPAQRAPRTPLPPPGESSAIQSEVEWA